MLCPVFCAFRMKELKRLWSCCYDLFVTNSIELIRKVVVVWPGKKFHIFHGTKRFITVRLEVFVHLWFRDMIYSSYCSICHAIHIHLLCYEIPVIFWTGLNAALNDPETVCAAHACHQMAVLVLWLEKTRLKISNIPKFLVKPVKWVDILGNNSKNIAIVDPLGSYLGGPGLKYQPEHQLFSARCFVDFQSCSIK